jgi:hypothetical protein
MEFVTKLRPEQRELLQVAEIRYADASDRIGAFNLTRALKVNAADLTSSHPRVKRYVVETCFGYWVPTRFVSVVENVIESGAKSKRMRLDRIRKALASAGLEGARARYRDYIGDVRRMLKEQRIDIVPVLNKLNRNPFENEKGFEAFFRRAQGQLGDEAFIRRLTGGLVRGPVPEIWDDPEASREFQTSFFESLAYASTRSHVPLVAGLILGNAGITAAAAPAVIEAALVDLVETQGWAPERWDSSVASE